MVAAGHDRREGIAQVIKLQQLTQEVCMHGFLFFDQHGRAFEALGKALGEIHGRLSGHRKYSLGQYYLDLAWGVEYLVNEDIPYFGAPYAEGWQVIIEQFNAQGKALLGAGGPFISMPAQHAPRVSLAGLFDILDRDSFSIRTLLVGTESIILQERFDAELDEEGERGISIAERVKILRSFTLFLKNRYFPRTSRQDNPFGDVLWQAMRELEQIYLALGEPKRSVPWDQRNDTPGSGGSGWSLPG